MGYRQAGYFIFIFLSWSLVVNSEMLMKFLDIDNTNIANIKNGSVWKYCPVEYVALKMD
jgi:hypothetical protein